MEPKSKAERFQIKVSLNKFPWLERKKFNIIKNKLNLSIFEI